MPRPRSAEGERPTWSAARVLEATGLTSAELARRLADGRISSSNRLSYGRYDAIGVIRAYVDSLTDELANADKPGDNEVIQHERARWFRSRADLSELEYRQRRGSLVPVDDVKRSLITALTTLRQLFLGVPMKLAPFLAQAQTPAVCAAMLDRELRNGLQMFADAKILAAAADAGAYEDPDSDPEGGLYDQQDGQAEPAAELEQ